MNKINDLRLHCELKETKNDNSKDDFNNTTHKNRVPLILTPHQEVSVNKTMKQKNKSKNVVWRAHFKESQESQKSQKKSNYWWLYYRGRKG